MKNFLSIDVSELEAPEPLQLILAHLKDVSSDVNLRIIHRMEPKGLYPYLLDKYHYTVTKTSSGKFEIIIWQKNDQCKS